MHKMRLRADCAVANLLIDRTHDWREKLAQRLSIRIEVDKDHAGPNVAINRAQAKTVSVQIAEVVSVGNALERAGQIIRPAMVLADQPRFDLGARLADQRRTTMATAVVEGANPLIFAAHQDNRRGELL